MKTGSSLLIKTSACVLLFPVFLFISCSEPKSSVSGSGESGGKQKDLILVFDTSTSMAGRGETGGRNILDKTKGSIEHVIDKLEDGDRLTFVTFDKEIKIYPSVIVDDENDRDILKKYISMIEAKGKWTYTSKMIKAVMQKAEELSSADSERTIKIVVITDGMDNPPPQFRKNKLSLDSISKQYDASAWWIYLIDFKSQKGSREDPAKVIEADLKR
ncbi:MAG: VWA domain-containing protein [bacterium]|nr:VWA domain-containing protein [bacterium]